MSKRRTAHPPPVETWGGYLRRTTMDTHFNLFPPIGHIEPYMFRRPEYPDSLFWTTVISCPGSADQIAELSAAGWENVEHYSPEIRLCASSQLTCSFLLTQVGPTDIWAPGDDLQYAQRHPVLLAFQTTSFVDEQGSLQSLEHMVLGSTALVLHDDTCFLYHVDQLGPKGTALCQQIQGGIDSFTFPGPFDRGRDTTRLNDTPHSLALQERQRQEVQSSWAHTHYAAKELANLYWQLHQLSQKTVLSSEQTTLHPAAFQQQPIAYIPASLALQSALAAYSNAQTHQASGWKLQDQSRLTYLYQRSSKEYAHVEWRSGKPFSTTSDVESLWSKIRTFDDHDGDVLLCLLAHWIAASKDPEGYVWISSELMLSYRSIRPRSYVATDGMKHDQSHRQEDMVAISTSIEHIRNTHVTLQQQMQQESRSQPKRRGRPRKRILQLESYLVTITDFLQQGTLFAEHEPAEDKIAIAWRFRPGTCIEAFLDQQFAYLFQQSLHYDPLREQWEKRLARYLTFNLYGGQHSTITRTVSEILDELSLPINKGDPDKTKTRFEKALERLREDRQIAGWSYIEDQTALPSRRWFQTWRSYQVQIQATTLPTVLRHQRK